MAFTGKVDGEEIVDGDTILVNVPSKKISKVNIEIINYYISKVGGGI